MSTAPAKSTPTAANPVTEFLHAFFGSDSGRAWVTAFTENPFAPSEIADKAKAAKLSARMWAGGYYRKMARTLTDDANQYVAISLFKPAPWVKDGVQHLSAKRRKSHHERTVAVMVDDIGPGQKVDPKQLRLPCTALVETSPGNCQGWYALDPLDEDCYDPDLIARLLDRMVAAGLTKDLTDPGMKGVTRYGRLPGGVNNKPGREPWTVRLLDLKPSRVYTVHQIADAYGLDLSAEEHAPAARPEGPVESLVERLSLAGLNPTDKGGGKWDIRCPWVDGHTQGVDSGTAYFDPSEANGWKGGFRCHHGHCDERNVGHLFGWLDERQGSAVAQLGKLLKGQQPAPVKAVSSPVIERAAPAARPGSSFTDDELEEMDIPPVDWVVEELIAPGLTLLAAPPKMGKSYFVLQMALCVAAGMSFVGHTTRPCRVSYFDLEEWAGLLKARRDAIKRGNGIGRVNVSYKLEMTGGDTTVLQDIQAEIDAGSKLVILDLLARVRDELGEDAKKNAYARDYNALRKFADFILQHNPGVALVIVHHTNKGNHDDWQSKISGSQGLAGATHTNMVLTHVDLRGMDEEGKREALKYRTLHVAGKLVQPAEHMLRMMDSGGGWEISDKTADEVKTHGKKALLLQLLQEADGRWMTAKELKEHVDGTLDSIKKMLMRMAKKGEIESDGSGGKGYRARGA